MMIGIGTYGSSGFTDISTANIKLKASFNNSYNLIRQAIIVLMLYNLH